MVLFGDVKKRIRRLVSEEKWEELLCERDGRTIHALIELLDDKKPSVRGSAASALGEIGNKRPELVEEAVPKKSLLYLMMKIQMFARELMKPWEKRGVC